MEKTTNNITQPTIEKKRRKTVDDYLGINGLMLLAIVGALSRGGLLGAFGVVAGISGIYYLIKRRKELNKRQKYIGWILAFLWLVIFAITNQPQ